MYEIKKIKIWPFARSLAVICTSVTAVSVILVPIFFSIVEYISYGYRYDDLSDIFFEIFENPEIIIWFAGITLATAIISLIAGMLSAWLYNLVSQKIGGIRLEISFLGEETNQQHNSKEDQEKYGSEITEKNLG